MKKINSFPLILFGLLLFSCNQDKSKVNTEENKKVLEVVEQPLRLTEFTKVPEEIEGYACHFSETEKKFDEGKYLFVEDSGDFTFISVNDEIQRITQTGYDSLGENHFIHIYK